MRDMDLTLLSNLTTPLLLPIISAKSYNGPMDYGEGGAGGVYGGGGRNLKLELPWGKMVPEPIWSLH